MNKTTNKQYIKGVKYYYNYCVHKTTWKDTLSVHKMLIKEEVRLDYNHYDDKDN